jgi:hypothetical protein
MRFSVIPAVADGTPRWVVHPVDAPTMVVCIHLANAPLLNVGLGADPAAGELEQPEPAPARVTMW